MNERIKTLAKEAGMIYGQGNLDDFDMLKHMPKEVRFAELIVRECEKSIKSVPTHFEAQDKIIVECLKSIRETFRS